VAAQIETQTADRLSIGFIALLLIPEILRGNERGTTPVPRFSGLQPLNRRSGCSPAEPYPPFRSTAIVAPSFDFDST
jgi:hypothetical protein